MSERSELIAWLRGEVVGPGQSLKDPAVIAFVGRDFVDPDQRRSGPMAWRPAADSSLEEVLYFQRETPHRKYGAGLLHPAGVVPDAPDEAALQSGDTIGAEADAKEETAQDAAGADEDDEVEESEGESVDGGVGPQDDFEVTSPDARHPSSLGLSFCARLGSQGQVAVRLPLKRKYKQMFYEIIKEATSQPIPPMPGSSRFKGEIYKTIEGKFAKTELLKFENPITFPEVAPFIEYVRASLSEDRKLWTSMFNGKDEYEALIGRITTVATRWSERYGKLVMTKVVGGILATK